MNKTENTNYLAPKQEYKVLVRCFTYNQSQFIEYALNGFAMQQTNFPFVCMVMDDASKDGEQDLIKTWMQTECDTTKAIYIDIPTSSVIIVPHKTNLFCTFAFYLLKQNLYNSISEKMNHVYPWREKCIYEAICEGDDYWIDPFKLQKQADFMDENREYSLCFHNYSQLFSDGSQKTISKNLKNGADCSIREALMTGGGYMATSSMFIRIKHILNYPLWAYQGAGDFPLMLILFHSGKVACLDFLGSVYRINSIGSWSEKMHDISFIIKHFKNTDNMLKNFNKWSENKYKGMILAKRIKNHFIKLKYLINSILN